jgi:hypothetical protein
VRQRGKVDANQIEIVMALRKCGASVLSLSNLGFGCPDLLVGKDGRNWLMEIKDGSRKPSERRLTTDERFFHAAWRGQICVVETVEEALSWLEHGKVVCG